ncbi:tektin-2-like [Anticarsia gemmatalis]|uniref:tektin-2-like n=1 Tax=Anticarsia gemmatalis TaxID=129554 RepID=UPI003F7623D7
MAVVEDGGYLGCPHWIVEDIKVLNDRLSAEVVEQVNDTQELVMLNNFARESNEYQFKKCIQERISDIASWRWVLDDLNKRLKEAIGTLQYEHNAIRVVIERIVDELNGRCREATQPGALKPMSDSVEKAILQECHFLSDQKKKFEHMILMLEKQTSVLDKTRKRIEDDILNKEQALSVEESCASISLDSLPVADARKKQKKKESPLTRWEHRCTALKRAGLQALSNAIATRQQVRGSRVYLSIAAQSYSARVDSALRRRLHTNKVKLQDLFWQKEEAARDYKCLAEELIATEQNLLETMEQERMIIARQKDRKLRPPGELTKDEVDRKLRDELGRLRNFMKQLRTNHARITTLQNHLTESMARIDCCIEDIMKVVGVDENRILHRLGEESTGTPCPPASNVRRESSPRIPDDQLESIKEEDEEDDYPFDH